MKITLCTPEIHAELAAIAAEHPELVFKNNGYEYLHPDILKTPPALRVTEILREHVVGFAKFFNFTPPVGKWGLRLRFDYDWGAEDNTLHYTGVGYLALDELRDGFPENESQA